MGLVSRPLTMLGVVPLFHVTGMQACMNMP